MHFSNPMAENGTNPQPQSTGSTICLDTSGFATPRQYAEAHCDAVLRLLCKLCEPGELDLTAQESFGLFLLANTALEMKEALA